jgi:hypothetical protein
MSSLPITTSQTVSPEPITYRSAADFPDPDTLIPVAFPWILAAGQPYYDWLCGSRDAAERTVKMWMRQPSSEISIQRMQFLLCGSEIAGGIIGLSGAELKMARIADINSYWKTLDVHSRGTLIGRLSQSLDAFAPVAEDEYYASKMGLAQSFLGKGLSKVMLERCLDQGTVLGHSKFRADVQTENEPSLRCCRAIGFEIFYTGQSADGALRYHALRYERKNK